MFVEGSKPCCLYMRLHQIKSSVWKVFASPHGQVLGSCHNYGVYESLIVSSPGKTHRCKPPVVQVLATKRWQTPLVFTGATGRWAKMAAFQDLDPRLRGEIDSNQIFPPHRRKCPPMVCNPILTNGMNCMVEVEKKNDLKPRCCLNLLLEQTMDFLCYSGCWIR